MTVFDTRCDRCGTELNSPNHAVRFLYHPGDLLLKDDSGLLCRSCWRAALTWLGVEQQENTCARCGIPVEHAASLHVARSGEPEAWQLCPEHAVQFLNQLRTVEPKLTVDTLSFMRNQS
jgi:ribosomal protein L37E